MSIKRKKGLIFMLDVIIGMSILIGGVLLIISFFYTNPTSTQPTIYSLQVTDFLMSTQFDELASEKIGSWISSGNVEQDMLLAEKIALLCNQSDRANAENFYFELLNATIKNSIPSNLGHSVNVFINETTLCLNYTRDSPLGTTNDSLIYTNSRIPLFAIDNGEVVCENCIMEVAVW